MDDCGDNSDEALDATAVPMTLYTLAVPAESASSSWDGSVSGSDSGNQEIDQLALIGTLPWCCLWACYAMIHFELLHTL